MKLFPRFSVACATAIFLFTTLVGHAQSDQLISKSISNTFVVADKIFAFDEFGKSFSGLELFDSVISVKNGTWPYSGAVEGGIASGATLLLQSDSVSDSAHVGRVGGLFYDGHWKNDDSLVFLFQGGSNTALARGAGFTAMTVWHDTAILGFGRLGIGYAPRAADNADTLFSNDTISFKSFSALSVDTTQAVAKCVWNRICDPDPLITGTGLDSVLALAVDSSRSDSIWLLVATQSGLRRGLLGSQNFPRVSGIPNSDAVKNIVVAPDHGILWAFTDTHFYFSGDHGRTFHVPDTVSGSQTTPSVLQGYAATPQAVVIGDTTFVNFNLTRPGLVEFRNDSLQIINPGAGVISDVLIDSDDSLNIGQTEGSLTSLAIAHGTTHPDQTILAVGTNVKGIFYRRLDQPGEAFINLNRLRAVAGGLSKVITFPTLFGSEVVGGVPKPVHIGYRLNKSGNVTITVFNYSMKKVRTIVSNRPRIGGIARSENSSEDLWDGKDGSGRYVSVGTYYILVESDQGEKGWGKAISLWGQR